MIKIILFCCVFVVVNGATVQSGMSLNNKSNEKHEFIPIVKSAAEKKSDGSYIFAYEAGDGSFREEVGIVKNADTADEEIEVSGSYRYFDSEGQEIEVKYTAGKYGFVVEGTNIPKEITNAARTAAEKAKQEEADTSDT